jgi:uncharacterized protein YegL
MNIYNVIILDESGSMSSIYNSTLASMNEVLSGIKKNQEEFPEQHHYVTIVTFEGEGISGVKTRRDRVPIGTVSPFTGKDYRPGGCTPLYDAMGKTLNEMEGLVREDDKVMATIITDGMENSSQEYSGRIIKNLVARLKEKGWVLAYIGANQDSVEVAHDLNINNALDFDATPTGVAEMSVKYKKAGRKFSKLAFKWDELNLGSYDKLFEEGED